MQFVMQPRPTLPLQVIPTSNLKLRLMCNLQLQRTQHLELELSVDHWPPQARMGARGSSGA
eukprot:5135579-Pyramimonas_sp.AAC.1